jgi:SAM-dependent methyltransferase
MPSAEPCTEFRAPAAGVVHNSGNDSDGGTESTLSGDTTLLRELRKGQSILRSVTNVALSKVRLDLPRGAWILDAGGPSSWKTVDVPESHLKIAANFDPRRRPHLIADLDGRWPLADASFDGIVSFWVLEHLRRPHRFFEESFRCLKPGGLLLLTTVFTHVKHASPHDYFRFTDDGLYSLSRDAGFTKSVAVPLLQGPTQSLCAAASPWLLFPVARYLALVASRGVDFVLASIVPPLTEGWCIGYILLAWKLPGAIPSIES